jgi:dipeptidyl aminopeptidase/acylaminoacyl peptidase
MRHPIRRSAGLRLLLLALAGHACPASGEEAQCPTSLTDGTTPSNPGGPVQAEDLVRLRDIGSIRSFPEAPALALAPDGKTLAFQIRQADPDRNSHCLGLFAMAVSPGAKPRLLDTGGALIRVKSDFLDMADFPSGVPQVITPHWSPDGQWIAYLKETGGIVQVWRANLDGSPARALTRSPVDVRDFRIGRDGRTIIYTARPAMRAAQAALAREALSGFHYDERFSPLSQNRPRPSPPRTEAFTVDLTSDTERLATEEERGALAGSGEAAFVRLGFARSSTGRTAWSEASADLPPKARLVGTTDKGGRVDCRDAPCTGIGPAIWWSPDGTSILFTKRDAPAQGLTSFFRWIPGQARAKRLFQTEDIISDCVQRLAELICLRESAIRPRRIVAIDPLTGRDRLILDPNPHFNLLKMPQVERLHLANPFGIESFADLVYPQDYRPGTRYPLVIVQYLSRGFLRGGTGDEYPILPLAARGFAVLSVERPLVYGFHYSAGSTSYDEMDRRSLKDFIDRRSVQSSNDLALDRLVARGLVDPDRIGITGLSDGASTVQFAALNSGRFKAGIISNCCWEPTQSGVHGPKIGDLFRRTGWPGITAAADDFWSHMSIVRNSGRVAFPILMQIADAEYLSALEPFDALREAGKPVDLFVFPDEHHIKWQPAHRLAVYRRTIAWFDFWLKDIPASRSLMPADAARWQMMREGQSSASAP